MTRKETIDNYLSGNLYLTGFENINIKNFRKVFSELSMFDHDNYFRENTNLELSENIKTYINQNYYMVHVEDCFMLEDYCKITKNDKTPWMLITQFMDLYLMNVNDNNIDSIQSLEF